MLDRMLDDAARERALSADVDWRNAWAGLDHDGDLVAWPADAAASIGARALGPGRMLCIATPLEPLRREPSHASEMISELRSAERLRGILKREAWWLVAGEDDYVGWVHEWVIEDAGPDPGPPSWRYGRPLGTLWVSDTHAATPLCLGTPLWPVDGPLPERGGHHLLRTAVGHEGWVHEGELMVASAPSGPRHALGLVRRLTGTPYRWGGRSPLGFDCSGLVQFIAQLCGADLPRDAAQQARCGEEIDPDPAAWEAGDLVFFGDPADHVGFADGRGSLLHCRREVRADRIERIPELMSRVSGVRRWWGLRGAGAGRAWTAPPQ